MRSCRLSALALTLGIALVFGAAASGQPERNPSGWGNPKKTPAEPERDQPGSDGPRWGKDREQKDNEKTEPHEPVDMEDSSAVWGNGADDQADSDEYARRLRLVLELTGGSADERSIEVLARALLAVNIDRDHSVYGFIGLGEGFEARVSVGEGPDRVAHTYAWRQDGESAITSRLTAAPEGDRTRERVVSMAVFPGGLRPVEYRMNFMPFTQPSPLKLVMEPTILYYGASRLPWRYDEGAEPAWQQTADELPDYSASYRAASIATSFPLVFVDWQVAAMFSREFSYVGVERFDGRECDTVSVPDLAAAFQPFTVRDWNGARDCLVHFDRESGLPAGVTVFVYDRSRAVSYAFDQWEETDGVRAFRAVRPLGGDSPAWRIGDLRILDESPEGLEMPVEELYGYKEFLRRPSVHPTVSLGAAINDAHSVAASDAVEEFMTWDRTDPQSAIAETVCGLMEREYLDLWIASEASLLDGEPEAWHAQPAPAWITAQFPEVRTRGDLYKLCERLIILARGSADMAQEWSVFVIEEEEKGAILDSVARAERLWAAMVWAIEGDPSARELAENLAIINGSAEVDLLNAGGIGFGRRMIEYWAPELFRGKTFSRTNLESAMVTVSNTQWSRAWRLEAVVDAVPAEMRTEPEVLVFLPLLNDDQRNAWAEEHHRQMNIASLGFAREGRPVEAFVCFQLALDTEPEELALHIDDWEASGAERAEILERFGGYFDGAHELLIACVDPESFQSSGDLLRQVFEYFGIE